MSYPRSFKIKPLRRVLALLLGLAFLLSLCGCAQDDAALSGQTDATLTDDSAFELHPEDVDTPLDGGGAIVALAVGPSGTESGAGAMVWKGIETFCGNFNYTSQQFVAQGDDVNAAADALRSASESGARLVVCYGGEMAAALYTVQDSYPDVSYLCLDDEPHSEDYTNYRSGSNVHCVLFEEEQAGFLAGYAAVREGNTSMAFLGGEPLPGVVRYATGFVQGAEAAAEDLGIQGYIRIWYSSLNESNDDVTNHVKGWYDEGFQLVMTAGGDLLESCIEAARQSQRQVIGSDWDQTGLDECVVTSAVKCFNGVVQEQLYDFFTTGGWNQTRAGATERIGATEGAVELPLQNWRFENFSISEYQDIYQKLATGAVKVERFSDVDMLPQTHNITVDQQNV